tara:strand:+ start:2271 stop:2558 length:288 start_codon:yes stop_codon:yes gene_type:complete
MAKAFDNNIFSATEAREDPASDTLFVNGDTIAGHTDQAHVCRAIYVGGTGDLKVTMAQGSGTVVFHGVVAGSMLPIQCNQIFATGTTATNIIALF